MLENSLINTSLRNWNEQNKRLQSIIDNLSVAQLEREIASGKNTGKYLLGHLAAINHNMLVLFGLGVNPLPELDTIFLVNADRAIAHNYTTDELKKLLFNSVQMFEEKSKTLTEADWFGRHMNVTAEEFQMQPHRNKVNVLINRTLHLAYHMGQLSLLK